MHSLKVLKYFVSGNDIKNGSDEKATKQEKSEKHIEPNVSSVAPKLHTYS